LRQLILLGGLFVAAAIAVAIWPISDKNASQSERGQRGRSNTVPGTFRPTKEQWAGFKIEPVRLVSRRQLERGAIHYLALLAVVQAQAARYADTAALFQALGGGWWNRRDLQS
jgi:hypothetical protein